MPLSSIPESLQRQILTSLDSLDEGFMVLDKEWRVIFVNQAGLQQARSTRDQIVGRSLWSLYENAEKLPSYEAGHRAVSEGKPTHVEVYYPPYEIWFECHFYPAEGCITLVYRDITERKRTQAALEEALRRESGARQEAESARKEAEAARESTEALMEELQTQREELEVSHEEAQAINEELHAANEELTFYNRELSAHRDELERLRDEAETVQRIGSTLAGELNLDRLVQALTDAATHLVGAQFGAFFYNVIDEKGEAYTLYTLSGVPREAFSSFPMPRNTKVFAPTFRGQGVVRMDDVTQDPRYGQNPPYNGMPEGHLPVRSYLAIPVISRSGQVLGGLFFGHSEPARFREAHERMLLSIAAQAAVAMDNARLYEEARRATESLRESEERYRSLVQATSQVVWRTDREGMLREDMPGWREITGKPMESILGDGWLEDLHPEDRERARQVWGEAFRSGTLYSVEYRIRAADGSYRHLSVRGVPVHGSDGELREWVGLAYDVTERRRLEQALRESEELFRSLVEQSPLSVQIMTPDGRTIQVNQAWEELWGAKLEDLRDYNMLRDAQLEELGILEYVRRGFEGCPSAIPPVAYDRSKTLRDLADPDNPTRWVRAHIYPVKDDEGEIRKVVLIHEDFTDRKRLEEQLEERIEELADADRRKDEFLAMLAHELRNPLAPILSAVEILDRVGTQAPKPKRQREIIARQTRQLARLLEDLLDVSRVEQGKIELRTEKVSVADAVDSALEASRPWMEERGHHVAVRLPDAPLYVEADPARLEQVLVNLLSNAAKYTDPGGEIVIGAVQDGDHLALSVRDTGVGISAEFLPHVFDLFTQGHRSLARSEGGLGIGLTLTRTLVEMHGGTITAHSAGPGLGADFVVRLALADAPAERKPSGTAVLKPARPRRVLIIEDNRDAAETLGDLLDMDGHQITIAHDGQSGLQAVEREMPEVVILDIGLPGMDGYEVARRIRSNGRAEEVILIAVTGYGQAGDRERAIASGFRYHFTKPADPRLIREILARDQD